MLVKYTTSSNKIQSASATEKDASTAEFSGTTFTNKMQKKYALYVVICLSKTEQYNIENNLKCVDYVSRKADSILVQKKTSNSKVICRFLPS